MKRNKPPDSAPKRKLSQKCIIHSATTSVTDQFRFLSDVPDRNERLNELKALKFLRLQQPLGSVHRQEAVCSQIPEIPTPECGYHVQCYKNFTRKNSQI